MAQIGTIKLETQNSGVVDVPVFETGDSASGVYEFVRVETASGTGFIPVTDPADATYPYLRVQSQNNGIVAVTDTAGSDIPDSAIAQYDATNEPSTGGVSSIEDQIGDFDLSGSCTVISDGINGKQSYRFDGTERMQHSLAMLDDESVIFFVADILNVDQDGMFAGDSAGSSTLYFFNEADNNYEVRAGDPTATGSSVSSGEHLIELELQGGGDVVVRESGEVKLNDTTGTSIEDGLTIADRGQEDLPLEIDYGEIVVYDDPSDSDLSDERDRLADKWGIQI